MREFIVTGDTGLKRLVCNKCGRELKLQAGVMIEEACHIEYVWGYFSDKDLEKHEFDLCEGCYNEIVKQFTIPIAVTDEDEVL